MRIKIVARMNDDVLHAAGNIDFAVGAIGAVAGIDPSRRDALREAAPTSRLRFGSSPAWWMGRETRAALPCALRTSSPRSFTIRTSWRGTGGPTETNEITFGSSVVLAAEVSGGDGTGAAFLRKRGAIEAVHARAHGLLAESSRPAKLRPGRRRAKAFRGEIRTRRIAPRNGSSVAGSTGSAPLSAARHVLRSTPCISSSEIFAAASSYAKFGAAPIVPR